MPFAAGKNVAETLHNRLSKREAYRQLPAWADAQREAGHPVVIGLDGNNWRDWDAPESVFVAPAKRYRSEYSRMLDAADLFDEEERFHGPEPAHGLVDSLRMARNAGLGQDPHGSAALAAEFGLPYAATYLLKRDGHRMDRIYVSPEIGVEAAGVCHGHHERAAVAQLGKGDGLCVGSDHALVWTELAVT